MIKNLLSACALIVLSGCSVFGIQGEEQPRYKTKLQDGKFELRKYDDMIIARTTVSAQEFKDSNNKAFRRLAGYIFGKNTKNAKIAMTSPVVVEPEDSEKISMTSPVFIKRGTNYQTMYFVMPSKYNLKTLPRPLDKKVVITKKPGQKMATIRFSGLFSKDKMDKKTAELKKWMKKNKLYAKAGPVYAGYNPPWTIPVFRRNEVLIEVK